MIIFYDFFIFYIFLVKILFVLFSTLEIFYKEKNKKIKDNKKESKENEKIIDNLDYWKKRFEFIYIICMSLLLLYLFYPYQKTHLLITPKIRLLIFLFAFILITTSNWALFFKEPSLFITIQKILGRNIHH